ncbi:MAG TPA: NAD(P)H-dependent oxidoreductase subunit E [Tissierellaceae bacterium]
MSVEEKNKVLEIVEKHGRSNASLISVLQDIQEEYRYLPEHILEYISKEMDISLAKIYGIATFYEFFSLEPKGKYIIKICDGTACHVRKSIPILKALQDELKLTDGQTTTEDLLFTVETVSCLGACGLAPVLTINEKVYGSMTPESTVKVLNEIREGI